MPTDSVIFKLHDKSSPVNFAKYLNMSYNIQIVDYCDVISTYL